MSDKNSVEQPRSSRTTRRAARRRRLVIWSFIGVLLIAAIASGKPAYHWMKIRRAKHFSDEGEALAGAGKLNESAAKYRAALQLDPYGYIPLQGAARLATRAHRPEALELWEQVVRLPQSTVVDRQEYVAVLIENGRYSIVEKILSELLKANPDQRTLALAVRYASRTNDEAKAIEFARVAATRNPGDNAAQFQLAELLATSKNPAERGEARQILWRLTEKETDYKRPAIQGLARAPELTPEEQERALALLNSLPNRDVTIGVLAAELQLKLHPENAERIYDEASALWSRQETPDLVELARWLNLHQQSDRVLALIPEDRAVAREALLLARLDALASAQRWGDIDQLLSRKDLALDPSVAESFRARSAQGRGEALDAEGHWNRAISLAGGDPGKLRFVANFAEQSHADLIAMKAFDQLARFPAEAAFAYRGSQRVMQRKGDTVASREAADRLAKLAPEDPNAQDQLAYLNLLLGAEVAANAKTAKLLATKYPNRLSFRVTAALAHLREHDAAGALAQFNAPTPIEWSRTPPAWRAVYAASLMANEKTDEARAIIATIRAEALSKEERALIAATPGSAQP